MPTARRVTLSDVASAAGVSTTTASYILNGRAAQMRISTDAQERVRHAVERLGYRPDRNARSLRTSSTAAIGVITDYVASGMFSSKMLAGANNEARARDHVLVIGETDGDVEHSHTLVREMLDRRVDGLLYVTRTTLELSLPRDLISAGVRVVALNCTDPEHSVPSVMPDELRGGRTAARLVLEAELAGSIVVVGEDPTDRALAGPLRLQGIRHELTQHGREVAEVIRCDWTVGESYEAVCALLRRGRPPRVLICLNDRIAMGAYQALAAHGLDIPADVAVVSFDGSELADWLRPQLVSVTLPFVEMGAQAVRMLFDDTGAGTTLVPMPVHPGGSLGGGAGA